MKQFTTEIISKLNNAGKSPSMMRGGIGQIPHHKKDNKGFTLVELIVVIVILAILAAILIPGLLKWIDKAKEEQYTLEARNIYLAVQAEVTNAYAKDSTADDKPFETKVMYSESDTTKKSMFESVETLADVDLVSVMATYKVVDSKETWEIDTLTVEFNSSGKGITALMNPNETWTITVGEATTKPT